MPSVRLLMFAAVNGVSQQLQGRAHGWTMLWEQDHHSPAMGFKNPDIMAWPSYFFRRWGGDKGFGHPGNGAVCYGAFLFSCKKGCTIAQGNVSF